MATSTKTPAASKKSSKAASTASAAQAAALRAPSRTAAKTAQKKAEQAQAAAGDNRIAQLQAAIVDGLENVKAAQIAVFDTEHLSSLFERVAVASGSSNRQTKALAMSVVESVKKAGFAKPRVEGQDNGEWIIVDCGQAVVHIMQPAIRSYYNLEEIWGEKPVDTSKKTAAKKAPAKKAESSAAAAPVKAMAKSAVAKKAPTKTTAAKSAVSKTAATKTTATKTAATRTAAQKAPAKAAGVKQVAATTASKAAAKAGSKPAAKTTSKAPAKKATRKVSG